MSWDDNLPNQPNWYDEFPDLWRDDLTQFQIPKVYEFQENNDYQADPEAFQKGIDLFDSGNLPQAILALEAAVQLDPLNSNAWCKLGIAHAENDKDNFAIQAFDKALLVDPRNLEALIGQTVSYANELCEQKALQTLVQWLSCNPKYQNIPKEYEEGRHIDIRNIEHMFISASSSWDGTDPDVYSALGLIYNLTYEHLKAVECFRMALSERPNDYQLWNKLGASTANSSEGKERAHEAIDAYSKALQIKPTYTRARANMGISYHHISKFPEAAKCYLKALEINNTKHIWDNLIRAFRDMGRHDLVDMTNDHNVDRFREIFEF